MPSSKSRFEKSVLPTVRLHQGFLARVPFSTLSQNLARFLVEAQKFV